jgi:ATP phosphoribosyltransferase
VNGVLNFAIAKGRLFRDTVGALRKAGVNIGEVSSDDRKLVFYNEEGDIRFLKMTSDDVPTYVEYGAADMGISGKNTIMEENRCTKPTTSVSKNAR